MKMRTLFLLAATAACTSAFNLGALGAFQPDDLVKLGDLLKALGSDANSQPQPNEFPSERRRLQESDAPDTRSQCLATQVVDLSETVTELLGRVASLESALDSCACDGSGGGTPGPEPEPTEPAMDPDCGRMEDWCERGFERHPESMTDPDSQCAEGRSFMKLNPYGGTGGDYSPGVDHPEAHYVVALTCGSTTTIRLFFGADADGMFYDGGDSSGSGQDHCELIGAEDGSMAGTFGACGGIPMVCRHNRSGDFELRESGHNCGCGWMSCSSSNLPTDGEWRRDGEYGTPEPTPEPEPTPGPWSDPECGRTEDWCERGFERHPESMSNSDSQCDEGRSFMKLNPYGGSNGANSPGVDHPEAHYVVAQSCGSSSSIRLFFGADADSMFYDGGDSSGSGQDHCELIGSPDGSMAGSFSGCGGIPMVCRASRSGDFELRDIGHNCGCGWMDCDSSDLPIHGGEWRREEDYSPGPADMCGHTTEWCERDFQRRPDTNQPSTCADGRSFMKRNPFNGPGGVYSDGAQHPEANYVVALTCNGNASDIRMFFGPNPEGEFYDGGDSSGSGEDHCEMIGASGDGTVTSFSGCGSRDMVCRHERGGDFELRTSGHNCGCGWTRCLSSNLPVDGVVHGVECGQTDEWCERPFTRRSNSRENSSSGCASGRSFMKRNPFNGTNTAQGGGQSAPAGGHPEADYVVALTCGSAAAIRLFFGPDPDQPFYDGADSSGSGEDHCEMIGAPDGSMAGSFSSCNEIEMVCRHSAGQDFELRTGSHNCACGWMHCFSSNLPY